MLNANASRYEPGAAFWTPPASVNSVANTRFTTRYAAATMPNACTHVSLSHEW
jgi:hypothetical protein